MTKISLVILLLQAVTLAAQQITWPLSIQVENLRTNKGQLILDIYTDKTSFKKESPYRRLLVSKSNLIDNQVLIELKLPEGCYGIAMIDDVNMDQKINRNLIGYPLEGFGFSNYEMKKLCKPAFTDFCFDLDSQKKLIIIKTKY